MGEYKNKNNECIMLCLRLIVVLFQSEYLCETYGKGNDHKGHGKTIVIVLLDKLFCREFLTKCSWSGASRSGGAKIALKTNVSSLLFVTTRISKI